MDPSAGHIPQNQSNCHTPLRVLAVYPHYWPDTTPYAPILKSILERMAARGLCVTAFTGHPSYNALPPLPTCQWERCEGVQIRRIRLFQCKRTSTIIRLVNATYFVTRAILHGLLNRYDVILANGNPPVLVGLSLQILGRLTKARFVLHIQDIHPEALQAVIKKPAGLLYRIMLAVDVRTCLNAHLIVTLSADMKRTLESRGVPGTSVRVINNCPREDEPSDKSVLPTCLSDQSAVRFLYTGTIGRFQGLDQILSAFLRIKDIANWRLIFMGDGPLLPSLRAAASDLVGDRIHFIDRSPPSVALAAMAAADVGLVSLAPTMVNYAFPSKLITYLSTGLPAFAICDEESELAGMIARHKMGYTAAPGDTSAIAGRLADCLSDKSMWSGESRRRIAATTEILFGVKRMLAEWDAIVDELVACPRQA